MSKALRSLAAIVAAFIAHVGALAADCDFLPEKPRPMWAGAGLQEFDGQELQASGQAKVGREGLSPALAAAKQEALVSLAGVIQVKVTNTTTVEQSKSGSGRKWLTESNVKSLSSTTSDVLLRDVQFDEAWLDRKACLVWSRARIAQSLVTTIQREQFARLALGLLRAELERETQEASSLSVRGGAVARAEAILSDIDFADLRGETPGADYYRGAVLERRLEFDRDQRAAASIRVTLDRIDAEVRAAQTAVNAAEKLASYRRALQDIDDLQRQFPIGVRGAVTPSDYLLRGLEIEAQRNNVCGAARYWSKIDVDAQALLPVATQRRYQALRCEGAEARRSAWRGAFEGSSIAIACVQSLGAPRTRTAAEWTKGCEAVAADLRSLGAQVRIVPAATASSKIRAWVTGAGLNVTDFGASQVLILQAEGEVVQRSDPSKAGSEYQFSGSIASAYVESGRIAMDDRYSATTGWNPVSSQMTMELLALGSYRRFRERIESYLSMRVAP